MALTRKFLSALGIDADKVDEIIEAHAETVNALKAERDEARSSAGEVEVLKKELSEAKAQIETQGKDGFKDKYEALQKEFETFKADQTAKETKLAKETAYKAMLIKAGISEKRVDTILKVTDLNAVELEDGKIKGADQIEESVKKEWADFIVTEHKEGAGTNTPPADDGGAGMSHTIPSIF